MNYVELLAKCLYEQQNEPKKWSQVTHDYPSFAMRDAWLLHAQKECDEHLDRAMAGPAEPGNPVSDLRVRLVRIERHLGFGGDF